MTIFSSNKSPGCSPILLALSSFFPKGLVTTAFFFFFSLFLIVKKLLFFNKFLNISKDSKLKRFFKNGILSRISYWSRKYKHLWEKPNSYLYVFKKHKSFDTTNTLNIQDQFFHIKTSTKIFVSSSTFSSTFCS